MNQSALSQLRCRTEMWCKLLAPDSGMPIVVIGGADKAEFVGSTSWVQALVHEGDFAVESDRRICSKVVQAALDQKLRRLARHKHHGNLFRYFAARYEDFVGIPATQRSMECFLVRFGFPSLGSALRQKSGMGAVACAALSGDTAMLGRLVDMRASLETKLPELWEVALPIKATPLIMTLTGGERCTEALVELLKLRADPNSCDGNGGAALCYCTTPRAVDLLVEYRADVNLRKAPTMMSPISGLCARGASPETVAKLLEWRADVNLSDGGLGQTAIVYLTIFFSGNLRGLEVAELLLQASAEVNKVSAIGCAVRVIEYSSRTLTFFKKAGTVCCCISMCQVGAVIKEQLLLQVWSAVTPPQNLADKQLALKAISNF